MPKLWIDNQEVEVPDGATILEAAEKLGIDIPTLCHMKGLEPNTSCFVCVVKVDGGDDLVPSCATAAREGMRVESETDEVRSARRTAIELLLSDHVGDCVAPCQMADAQHANIPRMIRQIAAGDPAAAAATIRASRALSDLDGARAEKACRRARHDQAVAIDLLMKYAAAAAGPPGDDLPPCEESKPRFSVHMGKLSEGEMEQFLAGASRDPRVEPADPDAGFTDDEARREAARCLHCDCRKADNCRLRDCAEAYGAKAAHFRGPRRDFVQIREHPDVIYEPGKCIACGLCIQIARNAGEEPGLSFVGRGFDVRVAVPFERPMSEALRKVAAECVAACPTGALAMRD